MADNRAIGAHATAPGSARRFRLAARGALLGGTGLGLAMLFGLCQLGARLGARRPTEALFSVALARACQMLGATFVKIAQIASTRPDILPPVLHRDLAALRQHVRPPKAGLADLPPHLQRARDSGTLRIDPDPIAAGSIAAVYHATETTTGRRIALKVQRPKLAQRIRDDFALMRQGARLVGVLPWLRGVPVHQALSELEPMILKQLDFDAEAANLAHFANTYSGWHGLVLPEPLAQYCGGSVLAMTYVSGLDPDWLDKPQGPHCRAQIDLAVTFLFDMVFMTGKVHADLHPGNLIFCHDGRVAVLDAGMVAEMTPFRKRMFVYFFFGMITNSPRMCAHVLLETALGRETHFDESAFRADLASLIGRFSALSAAEYEVARFIGELFGLQRKHGLKASPDFLTTVLAFLMLEGTVKVLAPDYDFQGVARDYILKNAIRAGILSS